MARFTKAELALHQGEGIAADGYVIPLWRRLVITLPTVGFAWSWFLVRGKSRIAARAYGCVYAAIAGLVLMVMWTWNSM